MTFNETTATVAVNTTTNYFASVSINTPSTSVSTSNVINPTLYDRWLLPL